MNNPNYNNRGNRNPVPQNRPQEGVNRRSNVGAPSNPPRQSQQGQPMRSAKSNQRPAQMPTKVQPTRRTVPSHQPIQKSTKAPNRKKATPIAAYIAAGAAILSVVIIIVAAVSAIGSANKPENDGGNNAVMGSDSLYADNGDPAKLTSPIINETSNPEASAQAPQTTPPDTPANVTDIPYVPDEPLPVTDEGQTELEQTADAGKEYIDKIVFLGDSTTYGLRHYQMLEGGKDTTQVWTPFDGTLALFNVKKATVVYPETNKSVTIAEALKLKQPEYLVITLGVNGISTMREDDFKSSYMWLIDTVREVSPETKIICQSMFPVASNYSLLNIINNQKIQNGNKWIYEIAEEKKVKYLDTYSVLVGEDGWLPIELQNGDGLHLNAEGFEIELENIRTHAYPDGAA